MIILHGCWWLFFKHAHLVIFFFEKYNHCATLSAKVRTQLLILFRGPQNKVDVCTPKRCSLTKLPKRPHTFSCIPFKTWHPRERNVLLKMRHFITAILFLIITSCVILFLLAKESSNNNQVAYYSTYCDCNRSVPTRLSADLPPINWCSEETTWRGFNQNVVAYSLYGRSDENNRTSRYYVALDKIPLQVKHFYPGKI